MPEAALQRAYRAAWPVVVATTARVTRDLEEIGEVAHHGPEDLFIAIMTFAGAFALMLWLHPPLALMTLVIVPAMGWLLFVYGGRMTRTWRAIYARVGAFNVRLEESIGGIRVVQAFTNEAHERALFAEDNARYRTTKLEAYRIMAALSALQYSGMRLVQVVVMVAGAGFVFEGAMSTGDYVAFLLLVGVALIADGLHFHIPKGYLYFAIAFSALVEGLNILAKSRRRRRRAMSNVAPS